MQLDRVPPRPDALRWSGASWTIIPGTGPAPGGVCADDRSGGEGVARAPGRIRAWHRVAVLLVAWSLAVGLTRVALGVHFLLDGAKDKNGNSYDALVQDLMGKGVEFRLCRFTLERNKIDPAKVIPEATLVPSGVAEVSRLQFREGYSYLKP